MWSGWPSGLRRCVQVAVYSCRRGFESHFWHEDFWSLFVGILYLLFLWSFEWIIKISLLMGQCFCDKRLGCAPQRLSWLSGCRKKKKRLNANYLTITYAPVIWTCTPHWKIPGANRGFSLNIGSLGKCTLLQCWMGVWRGFATSFTRLRHCLHGRGFICNRIGFDAVTPFVYTAPVEFVIRTGSFWKRFEKWNVFKTIRFHGRVNGETASI